MGVGLLESDVNGLLLREGMLDRLAIGLSALCVVHCLGTAVFLALISAGSAFFSHDVHAIGLILAIMLGFFALIRGVMIHGMLLPAAVGGLGLGVMAGALTMPHNGTEALYTVIGVAILALGHDFNRRAVA